MCAGEKTRSEHAITFLRLTAIEIRRTLAEEGTALSRHGADKLRLIADNCDEEADALYRRERD